MRLIDADALYKNLGFAEECKDCDHQYNSVFCESSTWQVVCDAIYESPTIDAVPVVRCKDCKHRIKWKESYGCSFWGYYGDEFADGEMFCSKGKRKENDE